MGQNLVVAASLVALLAASPAWALPTIDGTRDVEYGAAKAVQTVETQFGYNFSELNAAYASCVDGRLSLMVTGNLEANFNRIEVFIDSRAGGQSVFDSSGNANAQTMDGLVFDAGFTADYHVTAHRGNDGGNLTVNLDFADLGAQTASGYQDIMAGSGVDGTGATGTGVNGSAIFVGYDNSNIAGGGGSTGAANQAAAAAVTTGCELGIALVDRGFDGSSTRRVMVGVNNCEHNYWPN